MAPPRDGQDAAAAVAASASLLLHSLRTTHTLCQQVRDRPLTVLQVHARLHQAFLRIAAGAKRGGLPSTFELSSYTSLLATFRALVEQHLRLQNVLGRLLASRRLLAGLAHVHHELDGLLTRYDLATMQSALLAWKPQFAANRLHDEKTLHTTMMALLGTSFLAKEYGSERRQALVLMELVCEFAPERERADRHSPQLRETFKMIHKRISNHCGVHLRRVPRWFLPTSEVDFTVKEHAIGLGGSFATTLHRGELFRGSKSSSVATAVATAGGFRREPTALAAVSSTSTVAVKCLWALKDVQYSLVEDLLVACVPRWMLANHPNVVSFRGANHAANPPYLVRNFTTYGSLTTYLSALQSRTNGIPNSNSKMQSLTWQLLYGASRGLIYLHEKCRVVHGGLRCNNILVNKKGHAVIADFGIYALACEARGRNVTDHFLQEDADAEEIIRWQAPECLRETQAYRESLISLAAIDQASEAPSTTMSSASVSSSSFATDVYAFGMCILEALTREVPWDGLEIAEVRSLKLTLGVLPPRPKSVSSKVWVLVQKMCASDPSKRISMREASKELKLLGYGDRTKAKLVSDAKSDSMEGSTESSTNGSDKENAAATLIRQSSSLSTGEGDGAKSKTPAAGMSADASERVKSIEICRSVRKSNEVPRHNSSGTAERLPSRSTGRKDSSDTLRQRSSRSASRNGSENIWNRDQPEQKPVQESGNIWEGKQQGAAVQRSMPRRSASETSLQTYRAMKAASEKPKDGHGSKIPRSHSSVQSAVNNYSTARDIDSEQPEHELETSEATIKSYPSTNSTRSHASDKNGLQRQSLASKASKASLGADSVADNETEETSSDGSENTVWSPPSVPVEFLTARSSNIDEDEVLHSQPQDEIAAILAKISGQQHDESRLVEELERLHTRLQVKTVEVIVQHDGIVTLLELVWRGYSVRSSKLALELLLAMSSLNADCIDDMVKSEVIKILTAVIKHRPSPEEIDIAATFLLEIIVVNDTAKEELWKCGGIDVLENNDVINRRFVQELKSIIAKFKRSEGYKHLDDGECNLAIEKFTDAIALDRKRACYYGDRSLAYLEATLFKKAAEDGARCMRYNPYDVIGYLRHGLALKALGRYNEALVSFRKGRQVDPKFKQLVDIIAELETQRGDELHSDAHGVRRLPRAEAAAIKRKEGDTALRQKEYQAAIAKYTEAIALDDKNDYIYLHRSIAYAGLSLYGRAIDDASKCIQINYRQIEGYYRLSLAFHAVGQREQALNTLYRGQEIDGTHTGINRMIIQLEEQEAAKAEMPLPLWYKEKGYRAFQLRSYEDAVRFYTKAIEVSPSDDDDITQHCYFYRSRANQCRGEFAAVIADCSHLLATNPKNAFARLRRADAYEQQRDYYMALQDIRELVLFNPEYEDAQARLRSLEHRCRLLPEAQIE